MELGRRERDSDVSKGKIRVHRRPARNEPVSLELGIDGPAFDRAIDRGVERVDEPLGTEDVRGPRVDRYTALFLCRSERCARSASGGGDENAIERDSPVVLCQERYELNITIEHGRIPSAQCELPTRSNVIGR